MKWAIRATSPTRSGHESNSTAMGPDPAVVDDIMGDGKMIELKENSYFRNPKIKDYFLKTITWKTLRLNQAESRLPAPPIATKS
jgi:hypothetical protein